MGDNSGDLSLGYMMGQSEGNNSGGFGGMNMDDLGDIFSSFMGGMGSGFSGFNFGGSSSRRTGPMKGENRYMSMDIDFLDAVHGVDKLINISVDKKCEYCDGTGAASRSDIETCPTCRGSGRVSRLRSLSKITRIFVSSVGDAKRYSAD